jgi:hypothetical protein
MSMFANAKVIETKPTKGKKKVEDAVLMEGLELFASLNTVKKNVEAQIAVVEAGLKGTMMSVFIEEGMRKGSKPESFKAEENGSNGSMQFKCRVSTSGLSEEEQDLLAEYKIPTDENVARQECFIINPAYTTDMELLAKVEEALSGLGLPADFIQKQEKVAKVIVTEDSINAVCKLKDKGVVAALMPVVSTLAIRATLGKGVNPFEVVEAALGNPESEKQGHGS